MQEAGEAAKNFLGSVRRSKGRSYWQSGACTLDPGVPREVSAGACEMGPLAPALTSSLGSPEEANPYSERDGTLH